MPHASYCPTQSSSTSTRRRHRRPRRSPPHTPSASSWLPPQSQSPARMLAHPHVDLSRPVADTACVVLPDAIVVDHAVAIRVRDAVTSADAKDVELVSAAVAIAGGNVGTSAFIDLSGPVADAARVVLPDASSSSSTPSPSASATQSPPHTPNIELVPVAFAIAEDVGAPTFVDLSGPRWNAACIVLPDAIVVNITHVAIGVRDAVAAQAKDVELVAATIAVAAGMLAHPHS